MRCLRVDVDVPAGVERTYTYNIIPIETGDPKAVRPRGADWQMESLAEGARGNDGDDQGMGSESS
jgi:hypothetical protein